MSAAKSKKKDVPLWVSIVAIFGLIVSIGGGNVTQLLLLLIFIKLHEEEVQE